MKSNHPGSPHLDVLIVDWHGGIRGKRLPLSQKQKVLNGDVRLPLSTQTLDILSDDCDEVTGLGLSIGDPDGICVAGSTPLFLNQPWNEGSEQIICSLHHLDRQTSDFDTRAILHSVNSQLNQQGLYPVVAIELEFYLFDNSTRSSGIPKPPSQLSIAGSPQDLQLYDMRMLDRVGDFLDTVHAYAKTLGVPAETSLAEFGPGQFEINLKHQSDPVLAADHAVLFKQLVDRAAFKHSLVASFMAKPYTEHGGSGQHVHVSLLDQHGHNVFDAGEGEPHQLKKAIGTCLQYLPESLLLFAPHGNSFRRLQPESFAPVRCDWSYDHRGVALRLPATQGTAARFEHRVAGADANPYLLLAIILGGLCKEWNNTEADIGEPVKAGEVSQSALLTHDWMTAIERFNSSAWVHSILGERFCEYYAKIKRHEALNYNRQVSNIDIQTYLSRV